MGVSRGKKGANVRRNGTSEAMWRDDELLITQNFVATNTAFLELFARGLED